VIDFTSTNTLDPQTRNCLHLLTAVVTQACLDAALPLMDIERERQINIDEDAIEALQFLFDESEPWLDWYGKLIGFQPADLRYALLNGQEEKVKKPWFTENDFYTVNRRFSWLPVGKQVFYEPCYFVEQGEKARLARETGVE